MRGYLSGRISNLTQAEYEHNFELGEILLLKLGIEPVNPIKVVRCEAEDCNTGEVRTKEDGTYLHDYRCYMKYDFKALLDSDMNCMLPNAHDSRGAQQEKKLAIWSGIPVFQINEDYTDMTRIDADV